MKKKYDWAKLTSEFVNGEFLTVSDYQRYNEEKRQEGEERPRSDAIWKASKKMQWAKLKIKKQNKLLNKVMDGKLDEATAEAFTELLDTKISIQKALLKLIEHFAANPDKIRMRANLSDLVNDFARATGNVSKEQQQQAPHISVNNTSLNMGVDSRRKQLEEATDRKRLNSRERNENINQGLRDQMLGTQETTIDVDAEVIEESELDE